MEPPGGQPPASKDGKNVPNAIPIQPYEGIAEKSSYANSLTAPFTSNPNTGRHERERVKARHTTQNGMPSVIFKATDYFGIMADECKFTLVGRFLKPRPQIDRIRSRFKELITIKGSVKIGVFDNYNVFIDLVNEEDHQNVWFKRVIEIDGMQMWLQKWSPNFKPEEDLPIAPAWALLPGLPYHLHNWHYVKQLLCLVGTPLALDAATLARTRPTMAKIRVEVDFLKPPPESVCIGMEDDDSPLTGYTQKIEYEGIPKYCKECRKLGHNLKNCRVVEKRNMAAVEEGIDKENATSASAVEEKKDNKNAEIDQKNKEEEQDKNKVVPEDMIKDKEQVAISIDQTNSDNGLQNNNGQNEQKKMKNKKNKKKKKMPNKKNIVMLKQELFRKPKNSNTSQSGNKDKAPTTAKVIQNVQKDTVPITTANGEASGQSAEEQVRQHIEKHVQELIETEEKKNPLEITRDDFQDSQADSTYDCNTIEEHKNEAQEIGNQDQCRHENSQAIQIEEEQSISLPVEIKNQKSISLFVELNCEQTQQITGIKDMLTGKGSYDQGKEYSLESTTHSNANYQEYSRNETDSRAGRRKTRKAGKHQLQKRQEQENSDEEDSTQGQGDDKTSSIKRGRSRSTTTK